MCPHVSLLFIHKIFYVFLLFLVNFCRFAPSSSWRLSQNWLLLIKIWDWQSVGFLSLPISVPFHLLCIASCYTCNTLVVKILIPSTLMVLFNLFQFILIRKFWSSWNIFDSLSWDLSLSLLMPHSLLLKYFSNNESHLFARSRGRYLRND